MVDKSTVVPCLFLIKLEKILNIDRDEEKLQNVTYYVCSNHKKNQHKHVNEKIYHECKKLELLSRAGVATIEQRSCSRAALLRLRCPQ